MPDGRRSSSNPMGPTRTLSAFSAEVFRRFDTQDVKLDALEEQVKFTNGKVRQHDTDLAIMKDRQEYQTKDLRSSTLSKDPGIKQDDWKPHPVIRNMMAIPFMMYLTVIVAMLIAWITGQGPNLVQIYAEHEGVHLGQQHQTTTTTTTK